MTPLEKKDYGQRLLRLWLGREVAVEALKSETSADRSGGRMPLIGKQQDP